MLDLGAAPGSWSRYAAERVGARGAVVAVDLQEIVGLALANVMVVRGDAFAVRDAANGRDADDPVVARSPYDVVLSDMAPATSGTRLTDQVRSYELFMSALEVAVELGRPGAAFVGKIFMSGDFPDARRSVATRFATCRVLKPEGTRSNSTEIYVVGFELKGGRGRG